MSYEVTTMQGGAMMPQGANASVQIAQSAAVAEIIGTIQVAKACPREIIQARDAIRNACTDPKLAKVAVYQYARGGTSVSGPSVRLAEMIAQNWGNLQFGVVERDQRKDANGIGYSTCEAFAWDVQTNTKSVKSFQVPHIRYSNKKGNTLLTDPRDIYEIVANQGARRMRACILAVVPGYIVDEAVKTCEDTLEAEVSSGKVSIEKVMDAFAKYGITQEMVEKRIQCRLSAIRPAQIVQLINIGTSLRDGVSKPEDWFDLSVGVVETETPKGNKSKAIIAQALGAADASAEDEPRRNAVPAESARTPTEEIATAPAEPRNDGANQAAVKPKGGYHRV